MNHEPYPKIPRLMREIVITEKIDGTNAQVLVRGTGPDYDPRYDYGVGGEKLVRAGSRNRWLSTTTHVGDNFGFAAWVKANAEELATLGFGTHFGEWWGAGIGRGYGLDAHDKRLSLFDTRWQTTEPPVCCDVVPVLYTGPFDTGNIDRTLALLRLGGSRVAPGFMRPEGIVVRHSYGPLFKVTLDNDGVPKNKVVANTVFSTTED